MYQSSSDASVLATQVARSTRSSWLQGAMMSSSNSGDKISAAGANSLTDDSIDCDVCCTTGHRHCKEGDGN